MNASQPLVLAVVLASLACGSAMHFDEQEWILRYRETEDVLEVLVVSHGVHATGSTPEAVRAAVEEIEALAAGSRKVVVDEDWLFGVIDLDDEDDVDEEDPLARDWNYWISHVAVVRAGVAPDSVDGPALFQLFSVGQVTQLVALLDRSIDRAILEEGRESLSQTLGAELAEAWIAHVSADEPWLDFREGRLSFEGPMTPRTAANALHELLDAAAESTETAEILRDLSAALAEVRLGDDSVRLETVDLRHAGISLRFRERESEGDRGGHREIPTDMLAKGVPMTSRETLLALVDAIRR